MKKETKTYLIIGIIVLLIIFGIFYFKKSPPSIEEQTAVCIGKNSQLYVQIGCSACKIQEGIFGENYKSLTVIDCYYEREQCIEKKIAVTPTWIINGKQYTGVRSVEELKNLTNC